MLSVRKVLLQAASVQPRNFVVMEVKGNLIQECRAEVLAKFKIAMFKPVAEVLMGEPTADFKKLAQKQIFDAKQEASNLEFKVKRAEERRQWSIKKKQQEFVRDQKKQEKAKR